MAPSKSRKRKSADDLVIEAGAMNMGDSKRRRNLPVRAKEGETSAKPAPSGNLRVFTDEDDGEAVIPTPSPVAPPKPVAPADDVEEEDSDDDAPEAVSTTRAASAVKESAQAAQKAAQEQAAAQKRKRQQRDTLFKQQAEERKKSEKEAETMETVVEEAENSENEDTQLDMSGRRRRVGKIQVPNLLPAEFLTDSSSENDDEDEDDQETSAARPKKRKIATVERSLSRQDRGPRDERVGSTVYRVTKQVDERMAPKLRKHAKSSKELLLKRNRPAIKSGSGFFVRK